MNNVDNIILTVFLFCTEKYKPEVDNTDRACEVGILTEGLYFQVRIRKQLVLYLLTGRNSVNKKGFKSKANEWFYERQKQTIFFELFFRTIFVRKYILSLRCFLQWQDVFAWSSFLLIINVYVKNAIWNNSSTKNRFNLFVFYERF